MTNMTAVERELEGLRQSHRWHPMETAPQDGTPILAYAPDAPRSPFRITWWRQAKDGKGYIGWGEFNEQFWPPTHWMPLPEPPKQ